MIPVYVNVLYFTYAFLQAVYVCRREVKSGRLLKRDGDGALLTCLMLAFSFAPFYLLFFAYKFFMRILNKAVSL